MDFVQTLSLSIDTILKHIFVCRNEGEGHCDFTVNHEQVLHYSITCKQLILMFLINFK